jgi:hypothetical protein
LLHVRDTDQQMFLRTRMAPELQYRPFSNNRLTIFWGRLFLTTQSHRSCNRLVRSTCFLTDSFASSNVDTIPPVDIIPGMLPMVPPSDVSAVAGCSALRSRRFMSGKSSERALSRTTNAACLSVNFFFEDGTTANRGVDE